MNASSAETPQKDTITQLSIVLKVWIPFYSLIAFIFFFYIYIMRKLSYSFWILQGVAIVGLGVRWLSKRIMYIGTTQFLNNDNLANATSWLMRNINNIIVLIRSGIHYYPMYKKKSFQLFENAHLALKDILIVIGDDIPEWKRPLVRSLNTIQIILSKSIETSTMELYEQTKLKNHLEVLEHLLESCTFQPPFLTSMQPYFRASPFWKSIFSFFSQPYYMTFPMVQRKMKLMNSVEIRQLETGDALISVFIFPPTTENPCNSKYVLLASPNACIAELSYYTKDPQIKFYTNCGYHVVAYDYRGCGGSTGDVTPDNTVSDAILILQFMNTNYNLSLAFVHGTSIGGYVVAGLAHTSPISIYDRTFATMDAMVQGMVPPFLATLVRFFRRWPMDVLERVDLTKPALFVFDPQDEIISFPASLFIGLTNKYYHPDPTTQCIENEIRRGYLVLLQSICASLEQAQIDLSTIREMISLNETTNVLNGPDVVKVLCLGLQTEILGIPLIDVVMKDLTSGSTDHLEQLLRIITVWRHRVSNISSTQLRMEEVVSYLESFVESESNDRLALQLLTWVCASKSFYNQINQLNGLQKQENSIMPERAHAMAIHTGHNSSLSEAGWSVVRTFLTTHLSK